MKELRQPDGLHVASSKLRQVTDDEITIKIRVLVLRPHDALSSNDVQLDDNVDLQ